jgi:hypothetical protein
MSMAKTAARCGSVLSIVALLGCGMPTSKGPPSTNKPRKHVMVQFTSMTLHPSHAQVLEGGNVVWINYADNYQGSVVFPESIASGFTCDDLRPLFMKTDAGYQSLAILPDSENVTLPCPLKPGEYDYELQLFEGSWMGPGAAMANPVRQMPGTIIVR